MPIPLQLKNRRNVVVIRKFLQLHQAEIYAAALRGKGIPATVEHGHLSGLIPLGEISLCVPKSMVDEATIYVRELEDNELIDIDEDFRDADIGDILYEKRLKNKERNLLQWWVFLLVLLVIILLILNIFNPYATFP